MYDIVKIIENVKTIYESNNHIRVLKDYERVLDELDLYLFDNWADGELVEGPIVNRHTVECKWMWPMEKMPNPRGGKRLLDYDCKVTYKKDELIQPRKIQDPDDYRPGTKKGKLDRHPIWIVSVTMPKSLMFDMYKGYLRNIDQSILDNMEQPVTTPEVAPEPVTDLGDLNEPQA
jgi:hypothetical protein